MKTRKLTTLALTLSAAMILSYIEGTLPPFMPLPMAKIGLANIAVLFALYRLGAWEAACVSLARVTMMFTMFGTGVSFIYSLAGAAVSFMGMALLKKSRLFSPAAVSVGGGVLHNCGQILAARFMLSTDAVVYYMPALMVSGVLSGAAVGAACSVILNRVGVK